MKNQINNLFKWIEQSLSLKSKLAIGFILLYIVGLAGYLQFIKTDQDVTSATVMIQSLNGGGGSGVVVESNNGESKILTNNHVCKAMLDGGTVSLNSSGENHLIKYMQFSEDHDVCLLTIAAEMKYTAKIAESAPNIFTEATISGHPSLLPNVVTKGHFSGKKIIQVFQGVKPCTEEEASDPRIGLVCMFFRGLPVVKTYESVLVTATIMAGSSGSAVYNEKQELSGLAFAGSGDLSYAFTVPYEYLWSAYINELPTAEKVYPNYELDVVKLLLNANNRRNLPGSPSSNTDRLRKSCQNPPSLTIKEYCDIIIRDLNWRRN